LFSIGVPVSAIVWYAGGLSTALRCLGNLDEALEFVDENLARGASQPIPLVGRAFICHAQGRDTEAQAAIEGLKRLAPNLRLSHVPRLLVVNDPVSTGKLVDALRELGLPD
jgi:hypothetical protein